MARNITPQRRELLNKLKIEDIRYKTFFPNWSNFNNFISPRELAKTGFFYFNDNDRVQCSFCLCVIGSWELGDDPKNEHSRISPRCPFILGLPVGNIRSGQQVSNVNQQTLVMRREIDTYNFGRVPEIRKTAEPERGIIIPKSSEVSFKILGIQPVKNAMFPNMTLITDRRLTFDVNKWPIGLKQKPDDLAEAGFYYEGKGDIVICYHCGLKLNSWISDDEPWEEHVKGNPNCQFTIIMKGFEFISKICENETKKKTETEKEDEQNLGACFIPSSEEEENTSEKSSLEKESMINTCKVCLNSEIETIFLPCGHVCSCSKCAIIIKNCPICREIIKAFTRAYIS